MSDEKPKEDAEKKEPGADGRAAVAAAMGDHTTAAAEPKTPVKGKPTMAVKVYAPFKIYYEGDAYSLTALNETGPFDILPHHSNFICMLLPCDLIIETPYDTQTVKISRALMHVKAEKVTIYLDV